MWRQSRRVKPVSVILVSIMLWHFAGLGVFAQAHSVENRQRVKLTRHAAFGDRDQSHFDAFLGELKTVVKRGAEQTKAAPEKGFAAIDKLVEIKGKLIAENEKNQQQFRQLESSLKQKGLPGEILNRQTQSVREYEAKYAVLITRLESIESAQNQSTSWWAKLTAKNKEVDWNGLLGETLKFLEENTSHPTATSLDSKDLPHRALKVSKPLPPKLTREDWLKAFPKDSATAEPARPSSSAAKATSGSLSTVEATASNSLAQGPPTPADLAETVEVKFTPEIQNLANSLDKNPVKIFNWVRNNIEFTPTWGSIQGAQLSLENRSANAFDTSSLLIALLRASGIPARYQMGTITVPINKAMSWLGGVNDPRAAALLLSSGGVPSEVVTNQGAFVKIRLEHVWVKVFVDYVPSGGAVNTQADTWIDIDPSFKQYSVVEGIDVSSQVVFNRNQYLSSASTVSPMDFHLQQVQNYLSSNLPGRTLDDVLRKESIIQQGNPILAVRPYTTLVNGQEFSSIPDTLRQKIKFEAFSDPTRRELDFSYTSSLPKLSGRRVTLSYTPSEPSVAQSFKGMYFTPPYLMRLKPVLRIDGAVGAQGQTAGRLMGETHLFSISLTLPGGPGEEVIENDLTVGSYHAIVLNPQKVTKEILDRIDKTTANKISVEDNRLFGTDNIDNSDRDFYYGTLLNWLGLVYFQRLDQVKQQAAALYKVRYLNRTYLGIFAFELSLRSSLFGKPVLAVLDRLTMDVDRIVDAPVSVKGDAAAARELTILTGFQSSFLEHAIFDGDFFLNAFSAVKALQQARAQGITIFEINADNAGTILPQLNVPDELKNSILDNINRGRTVTISQRDLTIGAIRGIGYIVLDPQTGDGSYLISVPSLSAGSATDYVPFSLQGSGGNGRAFNLASFPGPCEERIKPVAILIAGGAKSIVDVWSGQSLEGVMAAGTILRGGDYVVLLARVSQSQEFRDVMQKAQGYETECSSLAKKRKNIFMYIGHSTDTGFLDVRPSERDPNRPTSDYEVTTGDVLGNAFTVAYLAKANTGLAADTWAGAFAVSLAHHSALIGHELTGSIGKNQNWQQNLTDFSLGLMTGESVASAARDIKLTYTRGDLTITVR